MIAGLGVDLVAHVRLERELAQGAWTPDDGVFTAEELVRCAAARNPPALYAACFAAKEAALKALGLGAADFTSFREAELRTGETGDHELVLHGRLKRESERLGVRRIIVSVCRTAQHTIATVILQDGRG